MSNNNSASQSGTSSSAGFSSTLLIIVGIIFLIGAWFMPSAVLSGLAKLIVSGFGLIVLLIGTILFLMAKLYIKTPSNKAYVRTGMGGSKVIIDGGTLFIPMFHERMEILLETMKIEVLREGAASLLTKDMLRADVKAEFYIKVAKDPKAVIAAATSLGSKGINPDSVKGLVEEKLVSALRSVAAQSNLEDLNSNRQAFAESVQALVEKDLTPNGLTLETTTCSKLDQANYETINTSNVFDAQGAKTVAEKTQKAIIEKNTIVREAEVQIAEKDLERTQKINDLKIKEEQSIAERAKQVLILQATNESEARKGKAEQDRLAQTAEIEATEKVSVREQEKDKAIKTATVLKEQAIEVANLTKAQTVSVQEQVKDQAVQVAEVDKEKAVLQKGTERAVVEQKKSEAENLATKAAQEVITTAEVATADRQKKVTIVNQEAIAETKKINENIQTDISAYKITKTASANKEAAENEAEAITVKAEAGFKSKEFEAKGNTAVQMVPVEVAKAQVDVNGQQVEVDGKLLKYKAEFSEVSIRLETNLAAINKDEAIGTAFATAMGVAFSHANMNIWGDGDTAVKMFQQFTNGQGTFLKLNALGNGGDSRNQVRAEAKELVTAYLAGTKTALEVMGAADNVSTEVKSLVQEFVTSGGGNTLAGIGLMVKFLTGKDATKADMTKLEELVAEFNTEKE